MSTKIYSPKKHVRIDTMGGVVGECLRDEVAYFVDELNYTGTKFLEEGIRAVMARHGMIAGGMKTLAVIETKVSGTS